jgi:large subunit ribosomal protein L25
MVVVKVVPVGTAAGVKAGGVMRLVRRSLDIVCKPRDIPRTIDIDVSNFEIGTILKVSQLTLPEGCSIQGGGDFNMLTVLGKRAETERGGA